jgi:hypothetical protein
MDDTRNSLKGFLIFLSVVLFFGLFTAVLGTHIASAINHLTGWDAAEIRWLAIAGIFGSALGGLSIMRMEKHHLHVSAVLAFLMMALSAATWIGAVGPIGVYAGWVQNHEITHWVVEVMLGFMFIVAGLIGALVNSGLYLKPRTF